MQLFTQTHFENGSRDLWKLKTVMGRFNRAYLLFTELVRPLETWLYIQGHPGVD